MAEVADTAERSPVATYNIGPLTMQRVFEANRLTDVADMQRVFDAVESALAELESRLDETHAA